MPASDLRVRVTESSGDVSAPIAAVSTEASIAERLAHELGQRGRDLRDIEAGLIRTKRQTITGQRGHDHAERVGRIGAEARGIGEHGNDALELDERAGPAVQ